MRIDRYLDRVSLEALAPIRKERAGWLTRESVLDLRAAVDSVAGIRSAVFDGYGDSVVIGGDDELSFSDRSKIDEALRVMIPWRKGPFRVFGTEIDAEWRSYRKWDRLVPELPDLSGKVIADVGCNNGYYMFRMAAHEPALVLGIDPVPRFYYTFRLLHGIVPDLPLEYELLGAEHLSLFPGVFDAVFLMGVLYHHPDPIGMLRGVLASLKPGGVLILETQGIPGDDSVALFPEQRYAQVPGTWFVPTESCLINFVRRSGFGEIRIFDRHPMSSEEQRRTDWMPYQSYEDFIDPDNPVKTVEGYPAPWRFYLRAEKA